MADKPGQPAGLWRGGVGEFIKAQREMANLSLRQLAEIAKISNPYLSQVERGMYKPSADVLKSIAAALKISAETMYAQAGLLDEVAAPAGGDKARNFEDAVRQDARLSGDQKDTLLRIYRGFVERA
jgi:transcriptional regulator with XRE-family HTH domain